MANALPLDAVSNMRPSLGVRTLHLKVHPSCWPWLEQAAREANQVWNFANATRKQAARPFYGPPRYLSETDLCKLVAGCASGSRRSPPA